MTWSATAARRPSHRPSRRPSSQCGAELQGSGADGPSSTSLQLLCAVGMGGGGGGQSWRLPPRPLPPGCLLCVRGVHVPRAWVGAGSHGSGPDCFVGACRVALLQARALRLREGAPVPCCTRGLPVYRRVSPRLARVPPCLPEACPCTAVSPRGLPVYRRVSPRLARVPPCLPLAECSGCVGGWTASAHSLAVGARLTRCRAAVMRHPCSLAVCFLSSRCWQRCARAFCSCRSWCRVPAAKSPTLCPTTSGRRCWEKTTCRLAWCVPLVDHFQRCDPWHLMPRSELA